MKRTRGIANGDGALELIDEATHLLRAAPASTLAAYYIGSIPFVLGFLYFWADMSLSPFAGSRRAEMALAMAGLFLWMKFFQALFARRLRAQRSGEPLPLWNLRESGDCLPAAGDRSTHRAAPHSAVGNTGAAPGLGVCVLPELHRAGRP
jgi:hypothetical protein